MPYKDDSQVLFRETQRFRQFWVWVLMAGIAAIAIYALVQQVIVGTPFGNNPAPDSAAIVIAVIFGIGFPIVFYMLNLTVEVRQDGLHYRFFPFQLSFRRIAPEEISSYEVRTYNPVREYGGWGIRFGYAGKAYNVSENRGVQLELADGKRILFGSQRPEEMTQAMDRAFGGG